jgi:MYXO-CTERM domain-containing protein
MGSFMNGESPVWAAPPSFEHGLKVSLAVNGTLLVALYAVVAYTQDIRARIPFVLGIFSMATWAVLLGVAGMIGLGALAATGGLSRRGVAGAVTAAALSLLVLRSGVLNRLIPAKYESSPKYVWLLVALALAGFTLWRARRRVRHERAV